MDWQGLLRMIDPNDVPPVADNELLARFIVNSNEFRPDGNVTPKLFLPYKRVELSVNRRREATSEETWAFGRRVAARREKVLYGRAEIRASSCRIAPLDVVPNAIEPDNPNHEDHNPNHADVVGFPPPPRKDEQISLAQKLAAAIEGKWKSPPPIEGDVCDEN